MNNHDRHVQEPIINEALLLKITNECQCEFNQGGIHDSSTNCKNGELFYSATIQYSNEDRSETASIIAERIVNQVPLTLTVDGGTTVTLTSACTDCSQALTLSSAAGGGLFVDGFAAAALIIGAVVAVIV